ncbi:hypothetical protein HY501_03340, partial [Candidatus Woesearchaeota archaeon]|nr:hypothetical protein [Candidatus Woesearchaeota archaeon]
MALVWPFEWFARRAFRKGLTDTGYFRDRVRKAAYLLARGDSERVHEMALERLNKYEEVLREESVHFHFSELTANLKGREVGVFGTAAGLDKNCDAVGPLSHIFGFQEVGTIVMSPRDGNRRPRVVADEAEGDVYNAQGFPSKGLEYAEGKLRAYRESGGEAFILASVCGLPPTPDRLNVAVAEMETLLFHLGPFVDGFVWNPFSPNTDALKALRTPETFEEYAKRVRAAAGEKPALVKMGPYDDSGRQQWIDLAGEWIGGGGDGIVAV